MSTPAYHCWFKPYRPWFIISVLCSLFLPLVCYCHPGFSLPSPPSADQCRPWHLNATHRRRNFFQAGGGAGTGRRRLRVTGDSTIYFHPKIGIGSKLGEGTAATVRKLGAAALTAATAPAPMLALIIYYKEKVKKYSNNISNTESSSDY